MGNPRVEQGFFSSLGRKNVFFTNFSRNSEVYRNGTVVLLVLRHMFYLNG